jgi:orotidine-5'-phosphate decarboxylase
MLDYQKPTGMVALNPPEHTYWWGNSRQLIKELLDAGCRALKIQPELPGLMPKEAVKVVRQLERPGRRILMMNDRKIFDIDSTIQDQVEEDLRAGFDLTTVVLTEDTFPELEAIAKRVPELLANMVGVAVLTTQDDAIVHKYHGVYRDELLIRRTRFGHDIGFRTMVCGIPDVPVIHQAFPKDAFDMFYTPGARLPHDARDDQKIVGTPAEARRHGACWIVGRPVFKAKHPGTVYQAYAQDTL